MSFTNAPVTRALVLGIVSSSIAVSLLDLKHYFYILVDPHLWRYHQFWRIFAYQLCYTNSTEVLFAAMTLYQMRVVERMWGSRKFASFVVITSVFTCFLPPTMVSLVLRPISVGAVNYLPAGPTPIVFAILAQYHAIVPHVYRYRVAASAAPPTNDEFAGVTFSDKSYRYALAIQLALLQMPGSILGAITGWLIGYAWRSDLLPGSMTRWRVPGWLVGDKSQKRSQGFEGLRRRLEGENSAATLATGVQGQGGGEAGRRRAFGEQIMDQFRGAL